MAAQRKRKHASAEEQPLQQAVNTQRGIKSFGTIGKAHDAVNGQKKRKTAHNLEPAPVELSKIVVPAKNKRKRGLDQNDADSTLEVQPSTKHQNLALDASTPRSKRFKSARLPSPAETPSKCTADLFRSLKLEKAAAPIPFALRGYETPPKTPESLTNDLNQLPQELDDLVRLHSAFLSALSMYYSHNGTTSPVELRTLLHMVTKHWKKRAVSVDDLRMLLAVDSQDEFQFKDFGRAGIRLIKSAPRGRAIKRAASYVDEVDMSAQFEDALQGRWETWSASTSKENRLASIFLDQLPLAEVEKDVSVEKAAPMFARGQQRLADLKANQIEASQESGTTTMPPIEQKSIAAVQNRGTSLLDRILAKQALSSTLPAGPTRDQLERKAALQRIEDIARVLELLATGRSRCSFSMQALSQQVRQSLRNPISKEEIERCLGLMANEVTPGFVSLVCNGAVTGVVITKSGRVASDELKRRVQVACEAAAPRS
ncbi:hypothetical protein LTR09_004288 [Extremus antarcticus]|uniref:DNA replication factor Cdt1 C-terminal domain-containing protein n=1 Tax=Extremus antarcticus TaxID=702011 RepID=A0AAJ0DI55_9PEZI|nr:hypothetical protein LTR09_004288 [Extremus antarcticus]